MASEPQPLTVEGEAELRQYVDPEHIDCPTVDRCVICDLTRLFATLDAERARAALAEHERNHLQQRQEHFARLLHVPDGGQYRNDWDAAIERLQAENATLAAQVGAMRSALEGAVGLLVARRVSSDERDTVITEARAAYALVPTASEFRWNAMAKVMQLAKEAEHLLRGFPAFNCDVSNDCYDDCDRAWHEKRQRMQEALRDALAVYHALGNPTKGDTL